MCDEGCQVPMSNKDVMSLSMQCLGGIVISHLHPPPPPPPLPANIKGHFNLPPLPSFAPLASLPPPNSRQCITHTPRTKSSSHLGVSEELFKQRGHSRVAMNIVHGKQQEREGISTALLPDVDLSGLGHHRHLIPGVGLVGGALGVAGEQEAKDVGMWDEGFRERSAYG